MKQCIISAVNVSLVILSIGLLYVHCFNTSMKQCIIEAMSLPWKDRDSLFLIGGYLDGRCGRCMTLPASTTLHDVVVNDPPF